MPDNACKTLLNQLFGNVSGDRESAKIPTSEKRRSRVLVAVVHCSALPLVEIAFLGTDEVNLHFDMLANELLAQEFASFLCVECLPRIRCSIPMSVAR